MQGHPQRFKRQVDFGKEDQDLVSASATAKHASCGRCVKRRPGILDRDRQLPSSRPLVHSLYDHTTRSRLADGEAGKIPCVGFYGDRICGTSRSESYNSAASRTIGDRSRVAVRLDNCIHKGKSETVSGRMFSLYEALESPAADIRRESRAIVFDHQFC